MWLKYLEFNLDNKKLTFENNIMLNKDHVDVKREISKSRKPVNNKQIFFYKINNQFDHKNSNVVGRNTYNKFKIFYFNIMHTLLLYTVFQYFSIET